MAVVYLRVSTKEQAQRGGEAEGFSIPAQREACRRKAEQLGARVVEEFIDAGESARSADRPSLQRLLKYVFEQAVDFVIVHKVDRLAVIVTTTRSSPLSCKRRVPAWSASRTTSTKRRAACCCTGS